MRWMCLFPHPHTCLHTHTHTSAHIHYKHAHTLHIQTHRHAHARKRASAPRRGPSAVRHSVHIGRSAPQQMRDVPHGRGRQQPQCLRLDLPSPRTTFDGPRRTELRLPAQRQRTGRGEGGQPRESFGPSPPLPTRNLNLPPHRYSVDELSP